MLPCYSKHNVYYMNFIVDLEQTSPSPLCPGDDVILTCKVTVPEGNIVSLLWLNPEDETDQYTYTLSNTQFPNNTRSVGGFTTEFIGGNDTTMVTTATLTGVTAHDDGNKGISCGFATTVKTMKIKLSGKYSTTQLKAMFVHISLYVVHYSCSEGCSEC